MSTNPGTQRSTLTWAPSAAADLSGYEVWVDASGTGTYTLVGQVGSATFTLPAVTSVVEYDYRVRAFDETGNRSAYSSTYAAQLRPLRGSVEPGSPEDPTGSRMDP